MSEIVWDEFDEQVDEDHERLDQPSVTVTLTRAFPTYTEEMTARGYPGAKLIVLSFPPVSVLNGVAAPGVIRELPVGWQDMASDDTFLGRFHQVLNSYREQGWE